MDVREIQHLLGHASLTTTERYLQLRPGRISKSFENVWANQKEVTAVALGPHQTGAGNPNPQNTSTKVPQIGLTVKLARR